MSSESAMSQNVIEWLHRGEAARDAIDSFRDYWTGFNAVYKSAPGEYERDKISNYIEESLNDSDATIVLMEFSDDINNLVGSPVIDMRINGRSTQKEIEIYSSSYSAIKKLSQVFRIIYQVRCNLEHGDKLPSSQRDVRLVSCSSKIVREILVLALSRYEMQRL